MPNETHRAPLRYNISDFFSSLLEFWRETGFLKEQSTVRPGGLREAARADYITKLLSRVSRESSWTSFADFFIETLSPRVEADLLC